MGGNYQWPSLEEVVNYRRQVKNLILDMIQNTPLELPITMDSPWVCKPSFICSPTNNILYICIWATYIRGQPLHVNPQISMFDLECNFGSQWALLMGMDHERIHVETSSVLIRQLPVAMVTKPDGWVYGPMKYSKYYRTVTKCL